MADVAPTVDAVGGQGSVIRWIGLNSTDTAGTAVKLLASGDRCVHIEGTFGSATVVLQGSNEATPSAWQTLNDPQGNAISATAATLEALLENPLWVRPSISGATGPTDLNIHLISKG